MAAGTSAPCAHARPVEQNKSTQLDLLDADLVAGKNTKAAAVVDAASTLPASTSISAGQPLMVPTISLFEDPNIPAPNFPRPNSRNPLKTSVSMASCSPSSFIPSTR